MRNLTNLSLLTLVIVAPIVYASAPITSYTCSGSTFHIGASMDAVTQACGYPDTTTQQPDTLPPGKPVELWVYNAPSTLSLYGPAASSRRNYNIPNNGVGPNHGMGSLDVPVGKNPPPLIADNTFKPPMVLEVSDGKVTGIPGDVYANLCQGLAPKVGDPISKVQSSCGQPNSMSPERHSMNDNTRKVIYVWTYDQLNNEKVRLQFAQGQLSSIQVEK